MKKILLAVLVLMPALLSAQVAFQYTTSKTYTGAGTDTIYFYAPPAFGYPFTKVGFQPVNTDTTTNANDPPKFVFTTDSLDFQTSKVTGVDSASDSSMVEFKPLEYDGVIIDNDSAVVTSATAIDDLYGPGKVMGYKIGFRRTKAPYGVALIHTVGGTGGIFRVKYRIVWLVQVYK